MESLFVLLEEHAVMRGIAVRIARVVRRHGLAADRAPALLLWLRRLQELITRFHHPTEDAVLLSRAAHHPGVGGAVCAEIISMQVEMEAALAGHIWALEEGDAAAALDVVSLEERVARLLDHEEQRVFRPFAVDHDHDALWQVAVELERSVDELGRARRARLLEALERRIPRPRLTAAAAGSAW